MLGYSIRRLRNDKDSPSNTIKTKKYPLAPRVPSLRICLELCSLAMSGRVVANSASTAIRNPVPVTKQRPKSDTVISRRYYRSNKQENREENASSKRILDSAQEKDPCKVFDINLSSQKLTKIPDIRQFTKARILDLSCNEIASITGLEYLIDLKELKIYSNKVTEITGLEKNKELQNLLLQHNHIKAIGKGLQHVRKLKTLRLDSNLLSNIDHREISSCAGLTVLDISNNTITNISAINSLSALEEFDVSANRLTKVPDISRCRHLQELDLSRNRIHDLSGLKGLINLTILHLENNSITTLIAMGKQKKLQELYVSHNKISSLMDVTQQFPSLEVLHLCQNAIGSLDEFSHVNKCGVVELFVAGNPCILSDDTSYHQVLHKVIPSLELVDGVSLKRPTTSCGRTKPLMRPMTACQVLSLRQVEEQLKAAILEQTSFEESIARRFDTVHSLFDSLQSERPKTCYVKDAFVTEQISGSADHSRPVSRCSSRSRIADAQQFASQHFHSEQQQIDHQ